LEFHHNEGTISASFGTYIRPEQCADLFGELATLYTTGDIRIWSSSMFSNLGQWDMDAFAYGDNGGADIMWALGEPNKHSMTMGSQRPALPDASSSL
jgi:hypothetical protein